MQKISFLIAFLWVASCLSQHGNSDYCKLHTDNENWFATIQSEDNLSQKIEQVVTKLFDDQQYFTTHPRIDNPDDRRVFGTLPCTTDCSIRFGLIYGKNKGMVLDLNSNPALENLILEFNSENIERIKVKKIQEKDINIFEANLRSGIVLYTDNKALKKKIKRFLKEQQKDKVQTETVIANN